MGEDVSNEIGRECLLTRTRRISRVLTGLYDQELRPFGINSPQFTLLLVLARIEPASRAELGRANHQDRSTLSRNLQLILSAGWVEESEAKGGRSRPLVVTEAGRKLIAEAAPAWRKAQARAKALLGDTGVLALKAMAAAL